MKNVLLVILVLAAFACNNEAPKSDAVPAADSTVADAADKSGAAFDGPEVDLMKKMVSSYEKGDFEAARSCYADSARYFANVWILDSTQAGIPIDDVIANDKKYFAELEGVSMGNPIYEVVTTKDGSKYGHCWVRFQAKHKKTGKALDVPLFASFGIKDGKLMWEWNIHDSKRFE